MYLQGWVSHLDAAHHQASNTKCDARTRKKSTSPRNPPRQVRQEPATPPTRELTRPKVLAARVRHGRSQLGERHGDGGANDGYQNDAVDELHGAAGVYARDEGCRDSEP